MRNLRTILLSLLLTVPALGQDHADHIRRARQFIADSMTVHGIPGVSITVTKDNKLIWSEGFGFADLEQRVPVTPNTKFRIGSVSKALTSVALGLLWEEGRLHFDSTIQTYVPSFPLKRWPVTVRQIAGHLAGIRHYRGDEILINRHHRTVSEGLDIFREDTLLYEPGQRYSYSSYGWNLLSAAVEGASGSEFLTLMQKRVFGPTGMRNTVADQVDSLIPHRARWYTEDSLGMWVNAPFVDNSYKWAGGGFLSTTEDLARFANTMLYRRILKPATVDLLWTPQNLSNGTSTIYGIGWFIRKDSKGRQTVGHGGGSVGGTASLLVWPEEKLVLTMLVNSDHPFVHHAQRIAEEFLRE